MPPVAVRIIHPEPDSAAGPLSRWVAAARSEVADDHRRAFLEAGADNAEVVSGPSDQRSFGERLRDLIPRGSAGGHVVLGSGAVPLATAGDRRAFVETAARDGRVALANNRYSADVVAISRVDMLPIIPDLPGDNALPRWLEEVAAYQVDDLRGRWRLGFDIDGPLDLVLLGRTGGEPVDTATVVSRLAAVRAVAANRRAELLIAGRTSAATLAWLERHAAGRVRAWVEERGLRAASRLAQADGAVPRPARAPASILGTLLEREGPGSLGQLLARFAEAAIVDSRVLLAHQFGPEEESWPVAEDRFASDLLLPERVADPWLRALTASAADAPIPVVLGGHTLVSPSVRLVIGGRRGAKPWR
jgi:hypothetical protein